MVQDEHGNYFQEWFTQSIFILDTMVHIPKFLLKRYTEYLYFECDFNNLFIYPDIASDNIEARLPFLIT
jgi:hypothetical protein